MDLCIVHFIFGDLEKGHFIPIEFTESVKYFITCGTHFWVYFNTPFGRPFLCIAGLRNVCHLWVILKLFQMFGIYQWLFFLHFGFHSTEKFISILLIGTHFIWNVTCPNEMNLECHWYGFSMCLLRFNFLLTRKDN